jgi:hypothetical protein
MKNKINKLTNDEKEKIKIIENFKFEMKELSGDKESIIKLYNNQ